MTEPKYFSMGIRILTEFLQDRETDYEKCRFNLSVIEHLLNNNIDCLVYTLACISKSAYEKLEEYGLPNSREAVRLVIGTQISRIKLRYYILGLFKTQSDGDLRTGTFVRDTQEVFFAIWQFEQARNDTGCHNYISGQAKDPNFLIRLGNKTEKPALRMEDVIHSRLQEFLLKAWVGGHKSKNGLDVPALCDCTDPAIAELAGHMSVKTNVTAASIKKTWQRLGLRKASKLIFKEARKKGSRIVFSDMRLRRD